jgi:hypothetical protein
MHDICQSSTFDEPRALVRANSQSPRSNSLLAPAGSSKQVVLPSGSPAFGRRRADFAKRLDRDCLFGQFNTQYIIEIKK